jgi:hypothetical protein
MSGAFTVYNGMNLVHVQQLTDYSANVFDQNVRGGFSTYAPALQRKQVHCRKSGKGERMVGWMERRRAAEAGGELTLPRPYYLASTSTSFLDLRRQSTNRMKSRSKEHRAQSTQLCERKR